jgi:hypothetical protein
MDSRILPAIVTSDLNLAELAINNTDKRYINRVFNKGGQTPYTILDAAFEVAREYKNLKHPSSKIVIALRYKGAQTYTELTARPGSRKPPFYTVKNRNSPGGSSSRGSPASTFGWENTNYR